MKKIYLDFETFYSSKDGYTLRKMTTQQYVLDPQFQTIGVSIAIDDGPVKWFAGEEKARAALADIDWADAHLIAQNALFDAAILNWRFGHKPAVMSCTMSMARASGVAILAKGASLMALAAFARANGAPMPAKGYEVVKADGKRLEDFTPIELADYGRYCCDDALIARALYKLMRPMLTGAELLWHDTVLRAYTEPVLLLDEGILREELTAVLARRKALFDKVTAAHGAAISSNPKLAEILVGYGVEPPTKVSKTTGKTALAFAKTDEAFLELLDHEDERVRILVEVRLGLKSSIEQTRTEQFLELAGYGAMPMAYKISGAHTGRLSGKEKNNVQNLPAGRNGQSTNLRRSITAPPGHYVLAADSSNIEVRVLAIMSGDVAKLKTFREGKDPYLAAASRMYGLDLIEITEKHKAKDAEIGRIRQICKSAEIGLGYGAGGGGYMTFCRTKAGIDMKEPDAIETVAVWRGSNVPTVSLWRTCGKVLEAMISGGQGRFGGVDGRLFYYDGKRELLGRRLPGIRLPDGYWLNYANLRTERDELNRVQFVYDQLEGKTYVPTKIYGGRLVENLAQGTAGALIKYQAGLVRQRYKVVMQTHDELVVVVPDADMPTAPGFMLGCFEALPPWLSGVTLTGEVDGGRNYGGAKKIDVQRG